MMPAAPEQDKRTLSLLVGCFAILVIAVLWRIGGGAREQELSARGSGAQPGGVDVREVKVDQRLKARGGGSIALKLDKESLRKRRTDALVFEAGLDRMKKDFRKGATLPLRLQVDKRCSVGDLDAIEQELAHSDNKQLLLTIEPIGESRGAFKPIVQALDPRKLGAFARDVKLPPIAGATQLGVFICKDSEGRGSCADKPIESINDVLGRPGKLGAKEKTYKAPDGTYFFSYAVVDPDGLAVVSDTRMPSERYGKLAQYVKARSGEDGDDGIRKAREANQRLSSVAPRLERGGLTLSLPKVKPECDLDLRKLGAANARRK